MNKTCATCGQSKPLSEFSERQKTKKFGKCQICLEPVNQTHVFRGNGQVCPCGKPLPLQGTRTFCADCAWKKREIEYQKALKTDSYEMRAKRNLRVQLWKEEYDFNPPGEGVKREYSDGKFLYRASDF